MYLQPCRWYSWWAKGSSLGFSIWVYLSFLFFFLRQKFSEQFAVGSAPLWFSKKATTLSSIMTRLFNEGELQSFSFNIQHISWNTSCSLGKYWPSSLAYGLSILRISNQTLSQILSRKTYFKVSKTKLKEKITYPNNE